MNLICIFTSNICIKLSLPVNYLSSCLRVLCYLLLVLYSFSKGSRALGIIDIFI